MTVSINMREFLEAGVHYGHQCRRWNPKMRKFIFGSRNGIHIIDLQKTVRHFKKACEFVENVSLKGGHILFVGTKRQARDVIADEASRCGMYYINHRWLGGTLTNYPTIRQSIHRLKRLEKMAEDGTYDKLTKKEALNLERVRFKLERNLGGIKDMPGMPKAIFIADAHKEHIAIQEARKLGIPIIAITDTNADPDGIDYVIPGNDDSLKSLQLFIRVMADAVLHGKERRLHEGHTADEQRPDSSTQEGTIYDNEGHSVKVMKKKRSEDTESLENSPE
ncbi:MAG: 30S ribosomal protein S2 [Deltaproteobacteria bacterium]|nr:30S ribosomal protein S2 [Deltaproteobacteria bacterium]